MIDQQFYLMEDMHVHFLNTQSSSNVLFNAQDTADHLTTLFKLNLGCPTNYSSNGSMLSKTNTIGMLKWNIFGPADEGKGYLPALDTANNPFFYNIDL